MDDIPQLSELKGTVQSVIYQNEENGYAVFSVSSGADNGGDDPVILGYVPHVFPGETVTAYGQWVNHPVHGRQFKAEYAEREMPADAGQMYSYLSGGAIKGIGPVLASLIVNKYGADSLNVIEKTPEKLCEIRGISSSRAQEFSRIFREQTGVRKLMEYMRARSVRPIIAIRMYKYYGDSAGEIARTSPYIIASPHIGGTFAEADSIANAEGFELGCSERIRAGALYELRHNLNSGHCFIPQQALAEATASLIEISPERISEEIDVLAEEGSIVRENRRSIAACYLPELYEAETSIAHTLVELNSVARPKHTDISALISTIEEENNIHYAPFQLNALQLACDSRLLIITGGPGTGKSRTVCGIVSLFDALGLKTLLTAPTGRAAKRLSELTGCETSTVHRLLGAGYSEDGDNVVFAKNEESPLACDAVVLDECSMVDILLMSALLKALPKKARLILIGDADQLPPVGPGSVFSAMIKSGVFPTVTLTEIFRQSAGSMIVKNAHMINSGICPDFSANSGDFFRLKRLEAAGTVETVTELCAKRLPEKMHIMPEEIQVISPTKKGELGTRNLNARLQAVLNPPSPEKKEKAFGDVFFREGDRVMQIKNNYDILWHDEDYKNTGTGIFNGDIGYIRTIDVSSETLEIDFDGRIALYSLASLPELEHAWAVTVHKSQGSEFRAVLLVLSGASRMLLTRSILYTAVTRAKELLILVGDEAVARQMIDNDRREERYSFLNSRIKELSRSLCG